MRKNISLYIADHLVDLDEQSFILFNYTMEDLSNPTIVKNSFSKQITLKGTPNNNRIFGDIFRLDRKTQYGDSYAGAFFDATRKTPFTIYNEMNEIVESGYVKLDEISKGKSGIEYKITLYGGLGLFFYNLMYNEDGSKKTLADLLWKDLDGFLTKTPGGFGQVGGYDMMQDCWAYLKDPHNYDTSVHDCTWANIINFAPAYNGLPEEFSADKAVCKKAFDNVKDIYGIRKEKADGSATLVTFGNKEGTNSNLMLLTNSHSEWEMRDLRWYLQRPVVSVRALFNAITEPQNNGGYEVILSQEFFAQDNSLYWSGWITLPLIPAKERKNADAIVNLLSSTISPAEYLISFAKIFGLVIVHERQNKKIFIMHRKEFYSRRKTEVIDLTERVNVESISISPVLAQSRFYQYGGEVQGEWAEQYKKDYKRDYAIHKVNTGNEFNNDTEEVTKDIIFKDAVEVQERSLLYFSNELSRDEQGGSEELFVLPKYEKVTLQVWGILPNETEQSMEEIPILCEYEWQRFPFNVDYPLSDWLPKAQFHSADGKATDGSDVLLVFTGVKNAPQWTNWAGLEYRISDDTPDMEVLNEGVPCWNYSQENVRLVTTLPCFRRCWTYLVDGDEVIKETFEWGEPMARGVNGVFHNSLDPATLYRKFWQRYQADRYDADTYKMTCKVDLSGLAVEQSLLGRFFYYDNSIYVLNSISNHSLTTYDDTECEFVRVQDINNYTE